MTKLQHPMREAWLMRLIDAGEQARAHQIAPALFRPETVAANEADAVKARRELERWSA